MPQYIFGDDADLAVPYPTPQAAIAAALAAGHGPNNPVVILGHPGTYAGTVVVYEGFSLVGLDPALGRGGDTALGMRLNGPVQLIGNGSCLANARVTGRVVLLNTGGTSVLQNVRLSPADGLAVVAQGTAVGRRLIVDASTLVGSIVPLSTTSPPFTLVMRDTAVGVGSQPVALRLLAGSHLLERVSVAGQIEVSGGFVDLHYCEISTGSMPCLSLGDNASAVLVHSSLYRVGTPGPVAGLASGAASLTLRDTAVDRTQVDAGLTVGARTTARVEPVGGVVNAAGNFALDANARQLVVVNTAPSPTSVTVTMPPALSLPDGYRMTIRKFLQPLVGGGQTKTLFIQPASGDVLEGSGTKSISLHQDNARGGAWVEFINDRASRRWLIAASNPNPTRS